MSSESEYEQRRLFNYESNPFGGNSTEGEELDKLKRFRELLKKYGSSQPDDEEFINNVNNEK